MLSTGAKCLALATVLGLFAGCTVLPKPEPETINHYLIESDPDLMAAAHPGRDTPVMIVTVPQAHGGYSTQRIAYMQEAHGLRYYTRSQWVDAPARMLAPMIADAMQATGQFRAFHKTPGAISADLRLDTELIRFHQDFSSQPSRVRVTLRAQLVDLQAGQVIATRQFDVTEPAPAEGAYGGVVAANRAVNRLLGELTRFCLASQAQ